MSYTSKIYRSGKWRVSIVTGNSKLGTIDNLSLTPGATCAADAPCKKTCYAMKAWKMYPEVRIAWKENERAARNNPAFFFSSVRQYLEKRSPAFFRIHVAGDFFSAEYLAGWYDLAKSFPGTRFLAFTKRYDLLAVRCRPENFQLIVSAWPGYKLPRTTLPIAYMQDGTEKRVKNAIPCPGHCDTCGMCWNLSGVNRNVVFNAH